MAEVKNDTSFFDAMNSILSNKIYWMTDDEKIQKYNPIGINIGLSQHIDTILYVNEMNINWRYLTPKMHYDYLYGSIRQMKRKFSKWAKRPLRSEDIEMVMKYYDVNQRKAEDYLAILNEKNLKVIRTEMEQGTT